MKWLQDLLVKKLGLPEGIAGPVVTLVIAVLLYFGAKYGITIPPAVITNNDTYLVVQPTEEAFLGAAAARGDRPHPVLMAICRTKAARQYAKDHSDLSFTQALKLAREVPDADIIAAMVDAKIPVTGAMVSGGPLTNLLEWIATHPEEVQAIIKLIMMLITLFADAPLDTMPEHPMRGIEVAQVPHPLAWERPCCRLAA